MINPSLSIAACMVIVAITTSVFNACFPLWLVPWMSDFHISRGTALMAFAIGNLVMGLVSPIVGQVLSRRPARLSVTLGALALSMGFFLGAFIHGFVLMIVLFATVLALGTAFSGMLPAQSIAVGIAPHKAGTISGLVTLGTSAGAMLLPSVMTGVVAAWGWRSAFLVTSGIVFCVVVPTAWFLLPRHGHATAAPPGGTAAPFAAALASRGLFRSLAFWMPLMVIVPAMFLSGTILTNAVAIAADSGIAVGVAGYLVPAIAAGGAAGSVCLGWICDRFDYRWVYGATATMVVLALLLLLGHLGPMPMALAFFVVGLIASGAFPVAGVMIVRGFGAVGFGRVMGLMMPPLIIANAVAPVIAGWVRDATGSYNTVFVYCAVMMLLSGIAVFGLRPAAHAADDIAAGSPIRNSDPSVIAPRGVE